MLSRSSTEPILSVSLPMHRLSSTLAQKGTAARRISRWHPYSQSQVATSSPSCASIATPHAPTFLSKRCTISSALYAPSPVISPSSTPTPIIPTSDEASQMAHATVPQSLGPEDRAAYARCLVDRAVKVLTEKWMPVAYSPFPQVLSVPRDSRASAASGSEAIQSSPADAATISPASAFEGATMGRYPYQSTAEHMPLRQFMHEVLRRSRTSCTSLQTALCYVEAISVKLPRLVEEEMRRIDRQNVSCILQEDADSLPLAATDASQEQSSSTEQVAEEGIDAPAKAASPQLPSPLLCPRRTFLAAILLASKFLQDRSYSNKAWGKLTGLAPREVGRCERYLFEALEYRLWVGKGGPFPFNYMDDGGPVIPFDAVFQPEPPSAAPPPPAAAPLQASTSMPAVSTPAVTVERDNRLRLAQSEMIIRAARAPHRKAPYPGSFPRRIISAATAGPALQALSRTSTWVDELAGPSTGAQVWANPLPDTLPALPDVMLTPVLDLPSFSQSSSTATFVEDSLSTSSLSPPGSMVHSESSAASFPDINTPPDMFSLGNMLSPPLSDPFTKNGLASTRGGQADPLSDLMRAATWY